MELFQLRAFERVASSGSFTRVAHELNISQPAVSAQIHNLERELEVRLLDRYPRRVVLTPAGEVLLLYARRMLNLESEGRQAVAEVRGREEVTLHLGASPTIGDYILPSFLKRFRELQPEVRVRVDVAPTFQVVQAVQDHVYTLGLIEAPVETEDLELVLFMQDEWVLVLPPGHPLAVHTQVNANELANAPWILREPGSGNRLWLEESVGTVGLVLTPAYELGAIEAIKHAVAAGLGISLLALNSVREEAQRGALAIARIEGISLVRSYFTAIERHRYLSPIVQAFMQLLQTKIMQPSP